MKEINENIKKLNQSFQSIDKTYEKYAKSVGLNYVSLIVLEAIYTDSKNCTQKRISKLTPFSKQSINVAITFFLKKEIIELKEIKSDRRNKEIILTEYGQKYAENIIGKLINVEEEIIKSYSSNEQRLIIELMNKIEISIKKLLKE